MTDGEILRQQLDKNLTDFDLRLVYSDWLESNNMIHEAQVQRWIAHQRVIPRGSQSFSPDTYSDGYDWICGESVIFGSLIPYQIYGRVLPLSRNAQVFYQKIKPKMIANGELTFMHYAEFPTQLEAYAALELVLLGMLHEGVELD